MGMESGLLDQGQSMKRCKPAKPFLLTVGVVEVLGLTVGVVEVLGLTGGVVEVLGLTGGVVEVLELHMHLVSTLQTLICNGGMQKQPLTAF